MVRPPLCGMHSPPLTFATPALGHGSRRCQRSFEEATHKGALRAALTPPFALTGKAPHGTSGHRGSAMTAKRQIPRQLAA
jgi:hypothetical protein